ncbi:head GIN domain-containing protein [Salinimicrobium sp. GXAS 041]|uniref:head GIN domain-containing protein n=1 Tax=Salinimicrobium sp. GXAS 041 TaxID=3400806 RepID=UPI003C7228AC
MWKNRLKYYNIVFGIFLLLFSGNAAAQDISEALSDFNELKVFNGIEVQLFPAKENRIVISGHSKEKVKYELVENRLELRMSLQNIWSEDNTLVKVYTRKLQVIDVNENSVVEVQGELLGSNLVFRAQEGAAVFAKIDAIKQSSKAVTGGQVQLDGKVKEQEIQINTGGQFYGKNLNSESTNVKISAGGRAEVYASEYCKATAKLGGTILVFGNPQQLDRKTSFGGEIQKMN